MQGFQVQQGNSYCNFYCKREFHFQFPIRQKQENLEGGLGYFDVHAYAWTGLDW